jgi:hypothetical protein
MFLFWGHVPDFRLGNVSKPTEVAGINAEIFHFQSAIRQQFVQQTLLRTGY